MNSSTKLILEALNDDATKAWLVALFTAVGAILSWATKLKWAEEYKKASEAKLSLVEEQISLLENSANLKNELNEERLAVAQEKIEFAENKVKEYATRTPSQIQSLFEDERKFYQDRIESFREKIQDLRLQLENKDQRISELENHVDTETLEIEIIKAERENLYQKVTHLERELSNLIKSDEQVIKILEYMNQPSFSDETIQATLQQFDKQKNQLIQKLKSRAAVVKARQRREERYMENAAYERQLRAQSKKIKRLNSRKYQSKSFDDL